MKNREQLHRFIKKLSKSEKRAFKLYMSKYETAKDKKAVKLFDAIHKMKEFDESKLIHHSSKKTLNYDLHRLRHRLLNALSDLNFKKKGRSLGEIINRIELGFKYEMPEIIEEELTKGYKLAAENEDNYINILITKFEHDLSFFKKDLKRIIEVDKKILNVSENIKEDTKYDLMGREVSHWYRNNTNKETALPLVFSNKELEKIFNGPIEDKANLKQSRAFYTANSLYAEVNKDYDTKFKIEKAIFDLVISLENNPQIYYPVCFSLANLILSYLRKNKALEAKDKLALFKDRYIESQDFATHSILEVTYYINKVRILFFEKRYDEIISFLPQYKKYFDPKKNELPNYLGDNQLSEFRMLVIVSLFYLKDYDKCLDWIAINGRKIKSKNSIIYQVDLHIKFVEVLCYYDLGYDILLNSSLNQVYYLINKKEDKHFENTYSYEILQAIVRGHEIPENWNEKNKDNPYSSFNISGLLEQYLAG